MRGAELLTATRTELRARLRAGHAVDPAVLEGLQYRGISLGLPAWVERLSWKTFVKAFHRDAPGAALRGWNVRLEQTGLEGPVQPRRKGDRSWTFGHFEVVGLPPGGAPGGIGQGLLLDYGRGGNPWWEGMGPLRDPVVALEEGDSSLLLGWSYLELGPLRLGTPSFFLLERLGPVEEVPARP